MGMMEDCHSPDYEFFQLFCDPKDVGHTACARRRTYVLGQHTDRASMLHDPWELQDEMRDEVMNVLGAHTYPADYLVASKTEVELEAIEKARVRRVTYRPGESDLRYLLTSRERVALDEYILKYFERTGRAAESDEDLFVFLGDNPSYSLTWSLNGKLPTYRMNSRSGLLWNCKHKRWLTGKERLCSLGWPVLPNMSERMECPQVGSLDVKRATDLAGNSMHMFNCGVVQAIALAAFGPSATTTAM